MGRKKKSRFGIRLNGKTVLNILGFFLIIIGLIMLASFLHMFTDSSQGAVLAKVNTQLLELFGGLSIFAPFIVMLLSGHFFNSKKLKFVKLNVTIGSLVVFISLIGILRSGIVGKSIFDNLTIDFTALGALSILLIGTIIGLILFLDTSIDVIVLAFLKVATPFIEAMKKLFAKKLVSKDSSSAMIWE